MPFGLQPIHLAVIVVVALVIFGPKRLPQLGRWIGRTFTEFRKGAREMTDGIREETTRSRPENTPTGRPENASSGTSPQYPETATGPFCTRCGAPNAVDARFCNKCGAQLPV